MAVQRLATDPGWRFRRMQPGEINIDPIEEEFFTTEALDSITDALVREAIQNSLDAANGGGPVTVYFTLERLDLAGSPSLAERYLAGLEPHLAVRHTGLREVPALKREMACLIIEDFGTRGLQGDETQYDDLEDHGRRNDFYYFWRNIGRTRKESTDIGRWGLGKTVFQAASRINAFFGLTRRQDDCRRLLMGQAALRIHRLDDRRYAPYGYFGVFDGDLALPVEDPVVLDRFEGDFGLCRGSRAGLSVVVPFVDDDLRIFPDRSSRRLASCFQSVIHHYFFPILSGALVVVLREAGRAKTMDAGSLAALLAHPRLKTARNFRGILDLARWAIGQPDDAAIILEEPPHGRAPKLEEMLIDAQALKQARQRFQENRRLAFRLKVPVLYASEAAPQHAGFSVYLERDETLDRAEDVFIRQGITIPEVSSLKFKGVRAIVTVSDPGLSTFLGDAENPAHTDWERNNKRFKAKYRLGPSTLDFVKTSPRKLVTLLTQPKRGVDRQMLHHLFALPAGDGEGRVATRPRAGEESGKASAEPFVAVNGANYLKLSPVKGGFRLAKRSEAMQVPPLITIWVAYEVRSGNPFKKFTALDFDLSRPPIDIQGRGLEVTFCQGNIMQIRIRTPQFRLAVTGFDMHRDLRIRTAP